MKSFLRSKWFIAYMIAWFISGVGGSIYYTYSRPYLMDKLGGESYYVVGLLLAAEFIPLALGIFSGFIADWFGRRKLLLTGLVNTPLYILLGIIDPYMIPLIVGLMAIIGSIGGSAGMGIILSATGRSGKAYSLLAFMATIGWVLGGILPGLLIDIVGATGLFTLVSLISCSSIIIQYIYAPEKKIMYEKPRLQELISVLKNTWDLVVASALAISSLSLFHTVISLKIYEEINKNLLLYGLALSTSNALATAVARPFSGIVVDKFNPMIILISALTAYIALDTSLYLSRGFIRLILWIIPIYPFRETATIMAFSRRAPGKLQATIAGVNSTTSSLSGVIVYLLVSITKGDLNLIYYIHIAMIIASILILTYTYVKHGKNYNE